MVSCEILSREEKKDYWQEQLKKWKESGISQSKFCRLNDLKFTTFCYWNKRLRKRDVNKKLIKLPSKIVQSISEPDNNFELIINDSIRIRISRSFEEDSLKRLLKTLGVSL